MKIKAVKRERFYGEVQLVVVMEDGSEEFLCGYDPTWYSVRDDELIGKTISEAAALFNDKEKEYFKHHDY